MTITTFLVNGLPSNDDSKSARATATKMVLRQKEEALGGRAAVERLVQKWAKAHPKELKPKRPISVRLLGSKLEDMVKEATEYVSTASFTQIFSQYLLKLRHSGRAYDIEAVIFAFNNHPFADPQRTAILSCTNPDVLDSLVHVGVKEPLKVCRALQAHMRLRHEQSYVTQAYEIVERLTKEL
jgi:hypothetical protein